MVVVVAIVVLSLPLLFWCSLFDPKIVPTFWVAFSSKGSFDMSPKVSSMSSCSLSFSLSFCSCRCCFWVAFSIPKLSKICLEIGPWRGQDRSWEGSRVSLGAFWLLGGLFEASLSVPGGLSDRSWSVLGQMLVDFDPFWS